MMIHEMLNYVVDTKDQEFIFKFAKQAKIEKVIYSLHSIAKSHQK